MLPGLTVRAATNGDLHLKDNVMDKLIQSASLAVLAFISATPAAAQDNDTAFQVKGFVSGVLPNGAINEVEVDTIGLPNGAQTRATDSVVPTIAAEYFVSPNFSIETICCVTPHDVRGTGTCISNAVAGCEQPCRAVPPSTCDGA